jgi:DNA-binding transcriptional regulator YiaG
MKVSKKSHKETAEFLSPTPEKIKRARKAVGHTQTQAAAVIHSDLRAWQGWETSEEFKSHRSMHPALLELYLIKTGQIPVSIMDTGA